MKLGQEAKFRVLQNGELVTLIGKCCGRTIETEPRFDFTLEDRSIVYNIPIQNVLEVIG